MFICFIGDLNENGNLLISLADQKDTKDAAIKREAFHSTQQTRHVMIIKNTFNMLIIK